MLVPLDLQRLPFKLIHELMGPLRQSFGLFRSTLRRRQVLVSGGFHIGFLSNPLLKLRDVLATATFRNHRGQDDVDVAASSSGLSSGVNQLVDRPLRILNLGLRIDAIAPCRGEAPLLKTLELRAHRTQAVESSSPVVRHDGDP
jgi:hypothetical protein